MHVTSTRGHSKVAQNGQEYEPVQGFVFDLPDELALHLLDMADQNGRMWRLPEQDDYDLDEDIAPAGPKKAPASTKRSSRPSTDGTPPVTGQ